MDERTAKIEELVKDEGFVVELVKAEPEQVQALFKDKGVEITPEEAKQFVEMVNGIKDGKLSEDDLEQVAGGGFWDTIWKGIKKVVNTLAPVAKKVVSTVGLIKD